jgi:hypothetical protein
MVLHIATNVLYRVKSTFLKSYFVKVFVTCNLLVDYFFNLWALSQDTLTNIFQTLRLDAVEGYDVNSNVNQTNDVHTKAVHLVPFFPTTEVSFPTRTRNVHITYHWGVFAWPFLPWNGTSVSYPARTCAVLSRHLWLVWLYDIFPRYLISGTIFEKKGYWT